MTEEKKDDKKPSGPQSDFVPVDDPKDAELLLREGAKTTAPTMLWTKDQKHVINTHMTAFSAKDKWVYCWVPQELNAKQLNDEMAALGISDVFFSVSLSRANIFFKAPFKGHDSGGLKFGVPAKVFKVQRRKDMRVPVPMGYVMKVEFNDPLFPGQKMVKKVIDISASGLAFVVSDADGSLFHADQVLKELSFTVRNRKITIDAEVRHTRAMPAGSPTPGVKIGVQFRDMKKGDTDFISAYVFEESRKMFSKLL